MQKYECNEESKALAIDFMNAIFNGTEEEKIASLVTLRVDIYGLIYGPYDDLYASTINPYYDADLNDPYTMAVFMAHFSVQCAILKLENPEWSDLKVYWEASKEMVHIALDIAGMVPVVGEICDLTNGIIYTIEGDGVNATLSFAATIPVLGWWATGAKYAKKTLNLANNTTTTLKWIVKANGLIDFGRRSQLRRVLEIVDSALQAHHIIPWVNRTSELIQKAAKSANAFHMNDVLNGIAVAAWRNQPNHNLYNQKIQQLFDDLPSNLTDQQAYDAVLEIVNRVRDAIVNNPNTHLNDLIF